MSCGISNSSANDWKISGLLAFFRASFCLAFFLLFFSSAIFPRKAVLSKNRALHFLSGSMSELPFDFLLYDLFRKSLYTYEQLEQDELLRWVPVIVEHDVKIS